MKLKVYSMLEELTGEISLVSDMLIFLQRIELSIEGSEAG